VNVGDRRSWIHYYQSQHSAAVEYGGADVCKTALVQLLFYSPMLPVGIPAVWNVEAKNVRMWLMQGLQNIGLRTVVKCSPRNIAHMIGKRVPELPAVGAP